MSIFNFFTRVIKFLEKLKFKKDSIEDKKSSNESCPINYNNKEASKDSTKI
jgi:hypothetical protein